MSAIIKLSKPIKVAGEDVSELELREPTVEDVSKLGYPYRMVQGASGAGIEFIPAVVLQYVSTLAAVPPSSLKTLSISDLTALQTEVTGFFGDAAE